MSRFSPTPIALVVIGLVLASCAGDPASPSPSMEVEPSTADVTASPEPTSTPEPTVAASPTEAPSPTPLGTSVPGDGFTVAPNPQADALFLDRDQCQNLRDGYQLEFPEAWYTNTEFREFAPCVWFSPTDYETTGDEVPPEIAITIEWIPDGFGFTEDPIEQRELTVGGQNALRLEFEDSYGYVIQLGPSLDEGPYLAVRTARDMGGDYELNRAVMDRMLATIEFVGSVQ